MTDLYVELLKDPQTEDILFKGRIPRKVLSELKLDGVDYAVVYSPITNGADMLLSLEIIFRRWTEQRDAEKMAHSDYGGPIEGIK